MTEMIDPFSNMKQKLHLLPEDIVDGIVFVLSAKANINVNMDLYLVLFAL